MPLQTSSEPLLATTDALFKRLAWGADGLTSAEAAHRLETVGPNVLTQRRRQGLAGALRRQLAHPLALLLRAAAGLAFTTQGPALGVAIVAVIVLNAAFSLAQERHAEHAVEALSRYLPPRATVVRDGRRVIIDAGTVVPGDLLVLREGDAVGADAKLLSGAVDVDMSAVTGESVPVPRQADPATQRTETVANRVVDAHDVVLSGTTCVAGEAAGVVVATGMQTELGRIAGLSGRTTPQSSPLERQVRRVAWMIAAVAVGVGVAFLPLGTTAGLALPDAAVFAIGLLVANVPEGLLPTITLALAVGVADLARRGGLVKRLSAVETLGSTDVICTDKTGTLTLNRMRVHGVWSASGRQAPDPQEGQRVAEVTTRCSTVDPETGSGDPTEVALLTVAERYAGAPMPTTAPLRTFHFDPRLRLMSVVVGDGGPRVLTKGAPEAVLSRSSRWSVDGESSPLTDEVRAGMEARLVGLERQGLRLIACATRDVDHVPEQRAAAETDLELLGFVALADPVRDAVPDAVRQAHGAGITVHVITGDHGATAAAVARKAGIGPSSGPRVVTGTELAELKDDELDQLLGAGEELVFARSSPEDKLRIATRLQAAGHVVAMTGDGVNDAPALRRADIGIAMGVSGTDVAREASTMVLTDDDFATIIRAVEAGRGVYENVRKFVLYIFAHAVPEIVPFLLFALSGGAVPLALTVVQILLIDLGTETLPALALGRETAEPGLMDRPPRDRKEGIITRRMLVRAWALLGLTSALLVTAGFLWVLWTGGWRLGVATGPGTTLHVVWQQATTMTFAGIVACQIGTAMASRTDRASLRSVGALSNRLLLAGIAFEVLLTAAVVYIPALQRVFGTQPLSLSQVGLLAAFPVVVWGVDELDRARRRRRATAPRHAEGPADPRPLPPAGRPASTPRWQRRLQEDR